MGLLEILDIGKEFDGQTILKQINLAVKDGEFFHIYTRTFQNRIFFEIVERHNYDLFGAANTPVRLAAQASLADADKRAEIEFE